MACLGVVARASHRPGKSPPQTDRTEVELLGCLTYSPINRLVQNLTEKGYHPHLRILSNLFLFLQLFSPFIGAGRAICEPAIAFPLLRLLPSLSTSTSTSPGTAARTALPNFCLWQLTSLSTLLLLFLWNRRLFWYQRCSWRQCSFNIRRETKN